MGNSCEISCSHSCALEMLSSLCSVFNGTMANPACHARGVSMSSALALCTATSWPQNFSTRVQAEIERGVHTAAAVEAVVLSHHQLRHPLYLGYFSRNRSAKPQCVVARLPSSKPVAATSPTPEHTLAMAAPRLCQRCSQGTTGA